MISISMPCFLQKGRLELARLNLTCFQQCINNTLFKSKAVEGKKKDVFFVDTKMQKGVLSSAGDELLGVVLKG